MIERVRVSVIVPVFGNTPYLAACRAALALQLFPDFEVITCAPPLNGLQNAGAARNVGLNQVRGEWVAFVDADDLPLPTMLQDAVALGDKTNADVVVFDAEEFDNKTGYVTHCPFNLNAGLSYDARFTSFGNCVWNKLFRASYLKNNNIRFQEIARSNDMAFTIEALARTDTIVLCPKILYRYRINAGGLQSHKSMTPDCWREALAECSSRIHQAGLAQRFAVALDELRKQVEGDNLPGGIFSIRRIVHSVRRRGLISFLKHAIGRIV